MKGNGGTAVDSSRIMYYILWNFWGVRLRKAHISIKIFIFNYYFTKYVTFGICSVEEDTIVFLFIKKNYKKNQTKIKMLTKPKKKKNNKKQ